MKIVIILIVCSSIIIQFSSCDTTEPEFNPNKVFVTVENGTLNSDGEFEVFNYSGQSIFINYVQYPYCSFFTYDLQKLTDSGYVNLIFDEDTGKWTDLYTPDSVIVVCELYIDPIEVKNLESFKQKVMGLDSLGNYLLNITYTTVPYPNPSFYNLKAEYKVTH